MELFEAKALLKNLYLKGKENWEQTRMLAYVTAQVNSSKKMKATDIVKFPWDDEQTTHDTTISNADVERLRARAKNYISKQQ